MAENFTSEYATELEDAYASSLNNAIDDGSVQTIDPGLILISYVDQIPSPGEEPTEVPTIRQTQRPSLRGSPAPTIAPTEAITSIPTSTSSPTTSGPTSTFGPSSVPSSIDITASPTQSPSSSDTFNPQTASPMPSPSDTACFDENDACRDVLESGECSTTKCAYRASEDQCINNALYMNQNCRKSCGLCGGETSPSLLPPTPTVSPSPLPCFDENDRCVEWAIQNQCTTNPDYMLQSCKDTCGVCSCEDKNDKCAEVSEESGECILTKCDRWVSEGECETNPYYMDIYCQKSCDRCQDIIKTFENCKDDDDRCAG